MLMLICIYWLNLGYLCLFLEQTMLQFDITKPAISSCIPLRGDKVRVFNRFSNILVVSWRSVLLVEETGVPGENHRPAASHWQTYCICSYESRKQLSTTVIVWIKLSCWRKGYPNKARLLQCWIHRHQYFTVVIKNWLTITKYLFLKWQWIFPFDIFYSLLYHRQDLCRTFLWVTWRVYNMLHQCLTFTATNVFLCVARVASLLSLLYAEFCFLSLCYMFCDQYWFCLWIVHCLFSL